MGNTAPIASYAAEVSASKDPSKETGVYRSLDSLKKLVDLPKGVTSSWDILQQSVKHGPNNEWLGSRKLDATGTPGDYEWITYAEGNEMVKIAGSYFIEKDLCPVENFEDEIFGPAKQLRAMGLFLTNRPEWFITEFGCASQDIALVPLYETLGEASMTHIIKLTRLRTMVISKSTFPVALTAAKKSTYLTNFIVVDDLTLDQEKDAKEAGVNLYMWKDIMKTKPVHKPAPPAEADRVNTLCFTSGTTGMPKGVIVTHRNVVSCTYATIRCGPLSEGEPLGLTANDCHISYLPLAHVFERLVCTAVTAKNASVGCFSGNMLKLMDDIGVLNPTVFVSVPRLFNRINDRITAGVDQKGYVLQSLFSWGLNSKISKFRNSASTTSSVWDAVVFGKFKGLLGNRLRFMVSGGAPLDPTVHERIQACFCAPILQGYGMSETFGPCFLCCESDTVVGHVGGVYSSVEFKLESVPDLSYMANDDVPKGELLVRGSSITNGYFRNAEANAEHFKDGWLHTGDICALLPSNGVKIIDRKKNLFKLAQGEYVAPEKIENTLGNSAYVNQIFVHGDSNESFLVAILVVDHDKTKIWAANKSLADKDVNSIIKNKDFKLDVLRDLNTTATNAGLFGFEKVKNVHIVTEEFTVENNLLTPTSKVKRSVAQSHFKEQIDALYAEGPISL